MAGTDLAPYRLLASALAGRAVQLGHHRERHGRSFTDGSTILVPEARASADAWTEIAVQACLIAGGALDARLMRELRGRARLAERYLCLEAVRCVRARAALAPDTLLNLPAFGPSHVAGDDAEASWRSAASTLAIGPAPSLFGILLPSRVLDQQREAARAASPAAPASKLTRPNAIDPDDSDESRILDMLRNSVARAAGVFGELLDQIYERAPAGADAGAGGQAGGRHHERSAGAFSNGRRALRSGVEASAERVPPFASHVSYCYPEWDERRRRYHQNFTHVAEVEPAASAPMRALAQRRSDVTRRLKRRMARLCLEYEPRRHQVDGDDLVLDDLVRLWTDVRAGHAGDERIYARSLRTRRDLGVVILLDITASSAEPGPSGASVFQVQSDAARRLTQALHEGGDRVALYGFHSWGRTLVRMQRIKGFDDGWDSAAHARFARLAPVGYSRLGAAIRHGAYMLRTRAETTHRLLVLISDAVAYDQGYEGSYARADTRRALAEARAAGIACVCVDAARELDAGALAETFGRHCYLPIAEHGMFDRALVRLFERAVADVQRRRLRAGGVSPA
jgi:nitric oxide reductase activation protein